MYKNIRRAAVAILAVMFVSIAACSWFDDEKDEPELDQTPPVLSIAPVDISTIVSVIQFGADLTPTQKNPAFEYVVNSADVNVVASCGGVVEKVALNDVFADYEVWVKVSANSAWKLIYDHVKNVSVSEGQSITAGTVLGKVGEGNRTELQINKRDGSNELSYCPFNYATTDFINAHKAFMEIWCLLDTVQP